MRGANHQQNHIFSYISPEPRLRKDHPLRPIRAMVDEVVSQMSPVFDAMYAPTYHFKPGQRMVLVTDIVVDLALRLAHRSKSRLYFWYENRHLHSQ